jgi:hypothetical protein
MHIHEAGVHTTSKYLGVHQDVLELEVPMDDFGPMAVLDACHGQHHSGLIDIGGKHGGVQI